VKNISENQKKIWCMVFFTFFLILIIPSLALASATPPGTTPVENVTLNGHSRPGYILSDGRFALQYAHDGEKGDPGNDYLVGYGKVGTFGTSFTSLSTPLLKDGITDKAYIDNVLQKEYGGGDSFHNITDVGVNPWKAKAGELADQAYIDAFQKTYNDDATIQAACGTENSNPDFWNCKYQTADKAGDAANNTSFNNSAQQAYALEHHNGLCYVGAKDGFLDVGNCLAQGMYYLLYAFSSILTLVGILFNFIIKITLVDMSKTVGSLKAINVGWIAFRDIANIVFIFALLYIS
jgi:hypothetical protein